MRLSCVLAAFNVNFRGAPSNDRAVPDLTFNTFNNCGYVWDEKEKKLIPSKEEDQQRDQNAFEIRKIKKTTQFGLGVSSSQPAGDNDEDEESSSRLLWCSVGSTPIASMNAFQIKMRDTFQIASMNAFQLTQDAYGAQLVAVMESSCRYTDKLAHQRPSINYRKVMLA